MLERMIPAYQAIVEKAKEREDLLKRQMKYLSRFSIKNFDHIVADYHDEAFEEIDCLSCGNCCRVHGPLFAESDLKRLAKTLGFDKNDWAREKLERDPDEGWRCKVLPCPFIRDDNACEVYEDRPKDCESYPYTAERHVARGLNRLAHNALICPAAYLVAMKIIDRFAKGETK